MESSEPLIPTIRITANKKYQEKNKSQKKLEQYLYDVRRSDKISGVFLLLK